MNKNFDWEIDNFITSAEITLNDNPFDKKSLVNETFVIWYALVEGISCDNFDVKKLEDLLARNFDIFSTTCNNDPDFCFIMGWVINVAPWYFKSKKVDEENGVTLLKLAYNSRRDNPLFKWAIRNELGITAQEISELENRIKNGFENCFNYSEIIRFYFLDIVS